MKDIYIIITIILIIIISISIIYSHINIDISKYTIKDKRIDKNIKVIFLSDLHNRNILNKIVNIINIIKPDIILFGGDMINESKDEQHRLFELYSKLKEYSIYYTFGNHEEKLNIEDKELFNRLLDRTNITLLNNSSKKISKNMTILGLDPDIDAYLKFGKKGLNEKYITDRLGKIDHKKYTILLAHNPLEFDSYVKYGPSLVLSGHIHGGLARISKCIGLLSPNYTLFPKYVGGEYNCEKTKMIVSRGLGYSKRIPFRIFNPAEIVVINLEKEL